MFFPISALFASQTPWSSEVANNEWRRLRDKRTWRSRLREGPNFQDRQTSEPNIRARARLSGHATQGEHRKRVPRVLRVYVYFARGFVARENQGPQSIGHHTRFNNHIVIKLKVFKSTGTIPSSSLSQRSQLVKYRLEKKKVQFAFRATWFASRENHRGENV